jgi:hypothetical protein
VLDPSIHHRSIMRLIDDAIALVTTLPNRFAILEAPVATAGVRLCERDSTSLVCHDLPGGQLRAGLTRLSPSASARRA